MMHVSQKNKRIFINHFSHLTLILAEKIIFFQLQCKRNRQSMIYIPCGLELAAHLSPFFYNKLKFSKLKIIYFVNKIIYFRSRRQHYIKPCKKYILLITLQYGYYIVNIQVRDLKIK